MNLAQRMSTRGRDACGYATEGDDGVVYYDKDVGEFESSALLLATSSCPNLLGHTRYATVGSKVKANAHPFHIGNIVGCHNGGIYNHKELNEKYERKFDVDSMHLIAHINEEKDCKELEGYGTVTWYDLRDPGAMYVCQMLRGDLEVETLGDDMGVLWASTRYALTAALKPACMWAKSRAFHTKTDVVYRVWGGKIEETDRRIELRSMVVKSTNSVKVEHGTVHEGWGGYFFGGTRRSAPVVKSKPIAPKRVIGASKVEEDAYMRAVAAYNRDLDRSGLAHSNSNCEVVPIRSRLTNKERKRLARLLNLTEYHTDGCDCSPCRQVFKLAVLEGQ